MSNRTATKPEMPTGEARSATITEMRSGAQTPEALFALIKGARKPELSFFTHRHQPTDADLGWAAGVLDGEGCVHIARQTYPAGSPRQTTYQLRITITQNCLGVLREFEWAVGMAGSIQSRKPTSEQNRTCHYLNYSGVGAVYVIERLRSLLRRKAKHAELAREFRRDCQIHVHPGCRGTPEEVWKLRRWYWQRMQVLNRQD